jgi:hypothetical protein
MYIFDALRNACWVVNASSFGNATWIGKATAGVTLAAIFATLWMSPKLEKRGFGRGLLEVETMLRPSRQYVRQAKEEKKAVDDDKGGPCPEPR